ncbi:cytochrome-c oxidase, cbb3-type subunit III [Novosphingobium sp. G106]|uniref:cytochrome-c oxidase, cbb3-type subunit III n=1 Tax=Novosphingobium sp. G106 TaxID=2849500 RepID=UPI001C2DACF8|nr:cytochrome-c oxidase, cbb3-type subunit III [Novosphingobium sp. G106]MBV1691948.1 cytochrome-c oxidase, cbb3-type subunit III [Novosphingobium sp. G106]
MTKRIDEPTGTETVGHEWDGIEELDTPMPRWWLWTFYLTILFAAGYVVAYPAIPLLHKGTDGLLGWSSRGQLAAEIAQANAGREGVLRQIAATPIDQLPGKPALMQAAVAGGRAAFRVNCVQCHGAGAAGVPGLYPNLNDDDWLWGGNLKEIEQTITHGIRQPGDDQTRSSLMPSFGRDAMLTPSQIEDVVSHVRNLSGKERPSASSTRGAAIFADNCAACHGPAGHGGRQVGAPNLTDAIWLYGGSREAIAASVTNAHAGVMPAWAHRLDAVTIRMLAAYVHSLGGGEGFAAPPPAPSSGAPADARP